MNISQSLATNALKRLIDQSEERILQIDQSRHFKVFIASRWRYPEREAYLEEVILKIIITESLLTFELFFSEESSKFKIHDSNYIIFP